MEQPRCPYCRVPLAPFNLLEDDKMTQIIFSRASIEPGLDPVGLRCTRNRSHEFGLKNGRLVEIFCKISRDEHVPPPNPSFEERANDWLVDLVFQWLYWVPFPRFIQQWLRDQILYPWSVAEAWHVYDPEEPEMSPEEEARIRADIEADHYGEGDEPISDEDVFYAQDDWDEMDDWERRLEEQDAQDAEDNSPEAWAEHRADEEDRDHGTYFPEEEDDGRWHDGWDDDSDEWVEDEESDDTDPKPDPNKQ